MWEKAGALVAVILLVAAAVGAYYNLQGRISSLENAKLVEWKTSIEKFQISGEMQCTDITIGYDRAHGHDNEQWCPDHYFITQIDIDGLSPDTMATSANRNNAPTNYPIIGKITCCRALPPSITKN